MTSFDRFSASRAFCVNKSARHEADVMSSKPVERGKSIVFGVSRQSVSSRSYLLDGKALGE